MAALFFLEVLEFLEVLDYLEVLEFLDFLVVFLGWVGVAEVGHLGFAVHDTFHHLDGALAVVAFSHRGGRIDHKGCEAQQDNAYTLVEYFQETVGDDALEQRGQLAFEDIHRKGGNQHAGEEKIALRDRDFRLAKDEQRYQRRPIEPEEGIEEIEQHAPEKDAEARRNLNILELNTFGLLDSGGTFGFDEHGVHAERGEHTGADIEDPLVRDEVDKRFDRHVARQEQEERDNQQIASTDTHGKRDSVGKAVVYAGLKLREESRAETEEQRQRDTAYNA